MTYSQPITVLLDLDDTLLGNDIHRFLPPYLESLGRRLRPFVGGADLQQVTNQAIQALYSKQAALTNLDVFLQHFCRGLGHPAEVLQPHLDAFYREDYPRLRAYTHPLPEARRLVERLVSREHPVVVATNPLFPATAIQQRLQWAGIDDFPYVLVTSMDNMHFCKPDPRYYQEILGQVGGRAETTWMVGDNPANDIIPARSLGLKTWWITPAPSRANPPDLAPEADRQGSLADFLAWVEAGGLDAP